MDPEFITFVIKCPAPDQCISQLPALKNWTDILVNPTKYRQFPLKNEKDRFSVYWLDKLPSPIHLSHHCKISPRLQNLSKSKTQPSDHLLPKPYWLTKPSACHHNTSLRTLELSKPRKLRPLTALYCWPIDNNVKTSALTAVPSPRIIQLSQPKPKRISPWAIIKVKTQSHRNSRKPSTSTDEFNSKRENQSEEYEKDAYEEDRYEEDIKGEDKPKEVYFDNEEGTVEGSKEGEDKPKEMSFVNEEGTVEDMKEGDNKANQVPLANEDLMKEGEDKPKVAPAPEEDANDDKLKTISLENEEGT